MTDVDDTEDSIAFQIAVPLSQEGAYALFVDRFGAWWPPEYTFCGEALKEIGIQAEADGHCYETSQGGERIVWGTVIEADRPRGLMFHWQITPDRQVEKRTDRASIVTVHFAPSSAGTTMTLVHSELSNHGAGWESYRAAMASEQGWPYVLEHYRGAAG